MRWLRAIPRFVAFGILSGLPFLLVVPFSVRSIALGYLFLGFLYGVEAVDRYRWGPENEGPN